MTSRRGQIVILADYVRVLGGNLWYEAPHGLMDVLMKLSGLPCLCAHAHPHTHAHPSLYWGNAREMQLNISEKLV